eukprot:TRINITY_DN2261_c0_g2_i7.p1 TRINITY_DN2261_c0_g2~~TRINITY_DN2261_c0_g2_i7.p1  ORF type:complete len:180 (+),score=49.31 TRINITY_DN2261_c0_g2_i7:366-905(+)
MSRCSSWEAPRQPLQKPSISQSSRAQRIATVMTADLNNVGAAKIQRTDAEQQIANSPVVIADIVYTLPCEQHGTIQTAQPANGSVDAQQSLLENQEAIFALDKHLLEQQLQEARQSLESVVSVADHQFALEQQETIMAVDEILSEQQLQEVCQVLESLTLERATAARSPPVFGGHGISG